MSPSKESGSDTVTVETSSSSSSLSSSPTAVIVNTREYGKLDLRAIKESLADAERSCERTLQLAVMRTSADEMASAAGGADSERSRGGHRDIEALPLTRPSYTIEKPFVPPKQILLYLVRMGSFTSMPKVIPAASECDCDADVTYPPPDAREELPEFLARCSRHLTSLPPPIQRKWINNSNNINNSSSTNSSSSNDDERSSVINEDNNASESGEKIRVLQWNVLSQALGTKNDNFVQCPASALRWQTRRFRMLEEVARHDADVVCLQEVDHFEFLRKSLSALGYEGRFFPKPDSPCLYLDENTGPDGCAIFWKADRFEMTRSESRVIEVWSVESNQVVLTTTLRSRADPSVRLCVATTHLKARNGALLSTLRNEQGKDIVQFLADNVEAEDEDAAVILTGDFNAEPTEPVFTTVTDSKLGLDSAYTPDTYTTWKIREDGEHKQTLDYIFYSRDRMSVEAVLEMPSGEDIGGARLPSAAFASDHLSLVADLRLRKKTKTEDEAAEN